MYRFLVVDDHAVVRRGIQEILSDAYPSAHIEAAASAEEMMKLVVQQEWDVLILDISMPGRSGLEILNDLNKEFPKLPVLILSMHAEEVYAVRVIKAGGAGYLNKEQALETELAKAVDRILQGRKYITASQAELLASEVSGDQEKEPHETLSDREFLVFKLIAAGKSTGDIADKMAISVNTVGSFRRRILQKMHMTSNAEMVAYAIKNKLI